MFNRFGFLAAAIACLIAAPVQAKPALKALPEDTVILFQGDSITDGGRWIGSTDLNHTMGQGYAYLVSAQVGLDYPERKLTFHNRGVSGDTVLRLKTRWQKDTLDLKPDVLSIMVGVNDTFFSDGETVETFEQTYDALIRDTRAALPEVKIVLGQPFVLPVRSYASDYASARAKLAARAVVVDRLAAKYNLPVIRYQDAFDAALKKAPADYWAWDGIHPTYAGHALMAREWLKTVDKAWKK